jgi:hypothetical protein
MPTTATGVCVCLRTAPSLTIEYELPSSLEQAGVGTESGEILMMIFPWCKVTEPSIEKRIIARKEVMRR